MQALQKPVRSAAAKGLGDTAGSRGSDLGLIFRSAPIAPASADRSTLVAADDTAATPPNGTCSSRRPMERPSPLRWCGREMPPRPLPTLLEFTIYVYPSNNAMECAAHGYVGRRRLCARQERAAPTSRYPFEHDGDDARAVINWIARQPWSDGRVGMYGEDYSGFTRGPPPNACRPALKAIATSAATAPGINLSQGGQHLSQRRVPLGSIRHRQQGPGRRDLQRGCALALARSEPGTRAASRTGI